MEAGEGLERNTSGREKTVTLGLRGHCARQHCYAVGQGHPGQRTNRLPEESVGEDGPDHSLRAAPATARRDSQYFRLPNGHASYTRPPKKSARSFRPPRTSIPCPVSWRTSDSGSSRGLGSRPAYSSPVAGPDRLSRPTSRPKGRSGLGRAFPELGAASAGRPRNEKSPAREAIPGRAWRTSVPVIPAGRVCRPR